MEKKLLGLYVHIPFCERKCDYCNFVSFCMPDSKKTEYVSALTKEIELQAKLYADYSVDTIFIGGGTPTTLPTGEISKILSAIKQNFDVQKNCEISIECNPNSLTLEKLKEYKNAGVTRLSVGLQAYNNRLLKLVGRLHTKKQFNQAIKNAKACGFENINVDLILGLPTQKLHHIKKELKHLTKLGIKHISAYGLIVEENTKLYNNLKQKKYTLPEEELQVKMYDYTNKFLQKHNIFRYEVSNFATINHECKHNLKYWNNMPYLGLGAVSSSYIGNERWKNTDNVDEYIKSVKENNLQKYEHEILEKTDVIEEIIMLSLRTQKGIDLTMLKKQFGYDLYKEKQQKIDDFINQNLLKIENNSLACTDAGFKLLNAIILELVS